MSDIVLLEKIEDLIDEKFDELNTKIDAIIKHNNIKVEDDEDSKEEDVSDDDLKMDSESSDNNDIPDLND